MYARPKNTHPLLHPRQNRPPSIPRTSIHLSRRSAPKLSFQQLFPIVSCPLGQLSFVLPARTLKNNATLVSNQKADFSNSHSNFFHFIEAVPNRCLNFRSTLRLVLSIIAYILPTPIYLETVQRWFY